MDKTDEYKSHIKSAKKAMIGAKADIKKMSKLKKTHPLLYQEVVEKAKEEYIRAERSYMDKMDEEEIAFYQAQPFGHNPWVKFPTWTVNAMHDFATLLTLLDLPPKSRILDAGCGTGWVSIFMDKMGYIVTGLDISESRIKIAKEKAQRWNANVEFMVKNAEELAYNGEYDAVLFLSSLHHMVDEKRVLENCFKALKSKGKLIMMEPGERQPKGKLALNAMQKYGTIEKGYSKRRLKKLLKTIGFEKVKYYTAISRAFDEAPQNLVWELVRMIGVRVLGAKLREIVILAQKT